MEAEIKMRNVIFIEKCSRQFYSSAPLAQSIRPSHRLDLSIRGSPLAQHANWLSAQFAASRIQQIQPLSARMMTKELFSPSYFTIKLPVTFLEDNAGSVVSNRVLISGFLRFSQFNFIEHCRIEHISQKRKETPSLSVVKKIKASKKVDNWKTKSFPLNKVNFRKFVLSTSSRCESSRALEHIGRL